MILEDSTPTPRFHATTRENAIFALQLFRLAFPAFWFGGLGIAWDLGSAFWMRAPLLTAAGFRVLQASKKDSKSPANLAAGYAQRAPTDLEWVCLLYKLREVWVWSSGVPGCCPMLSGSLPAMQGTSWLSGFRVQRSRVSGLRHDLGWRSRWRSKMQSVPSPQVFAFRLPVKQTKDPRGLDA